MIMEIVGTCNDYGIMSLAHILKNILTLIQIIGPILCIIFLAVNFTKLVVNPEEKKLKKKLFNTLMALLFLFAVPVIVNAFMYMLDDSVQFTTCWNYADKEIKLDASYIDTHNTGPGKIITDPSDYEKGEERKPTQGASIGPSNANISKRIFIGDSRTVQMAGHVTGNWQGSYVKTNGDDVFICKSGMGLAWMKNTGVPEATKYMSSGTAVIILMGVNDLYNLNEYVKYMNNNYSDWTSRGAIVYFDSVNPCNGKYSGHDKKITSFNNGIRQGLSSDIRYIDSNSYMKSNGFYSPDGLHYNGDTYKSLYNFIKSSL